MRNGLRLLVFDWDGTLMDSVASIVACTHATLEELGLERLPEETIRRTIGLGLRDSIEALAPGCDDDLARRILETYRRHWFGTYRDLCVPFPGTVEMLRRLEGANYLLAVATGKSRRGLERDFAATGLGELFHATRTADQTPPKPHPQMLLEILEELGSRAHEAVMIGDTVWDLEMARNAGTHALAVASGAQPREVLLELKPLACLERVTDLEGWLAGG